MSDRCDASCRCTDPIPNPPAHELDRIILGLRAAMAIKTENRGTYDQCTRFLRPGAPWMPPVRDWGWRIHFRGGQAAWMGWSPFEWGADA
jgi:hypothetical protein